MENRLLNARKQTAKTSHKVQKKGKEYLQREYVGQKEKKRSFPQYLA